MIRLWSGCSFLLALMVCTCLAVPTVAAQTPTPAATQSPNPGQQTSPTGASVSYAGGRLRIEAVDKTLTEILIQVSAAIKVKIDLPPDAVNDRLPMVKLGPGPPREVLASLLRDSHLSYLIQGSDADPEQIRSVLLMPSDPRGGSGSEPEPAIPAVRSTFARAMPPPSPSDQTAPDPMPAAESVASISPVPAVPHSPTDDAEAQIPPPVLPGPSIPADQVSPTLSQPGQLNGARIAPLSPPAVMSPQSINQQLQQMYQQRVQIVQQDRSSSLQGAVASHD